MAETTYYIDADHCEICAPQERRIQFYRCAKHAAMSPADPEEIVTRLRTWAHYDMRDGANEIERLAAQVTTLTQELQLRDATIATLNREADKERQAADSALTVLRGELEAARADGPDGTWICETCGFVAVKMMLRATDMAVGVDQREVQDVCPNDGTSLRRKTWKEDALDSDRVGREQMVRADEAESARAALATELADLKAAYRDLADANKELLDADVERDALATEHEALRADRAETIHSLDLIVVAFEDPTLDLGNRIYVANAIAHAERRRLQEAARPAADET